LALLITFHTHPISPLIPPSRTLLNTPPINQKHSLFTPNTLLPRIHTPLTIVITQLTNPIIRKVPCLASILHLDTKTLAHDKPILAAFAGLLVGADLAGLGAF
jgi:hypothetical protein